MTGMREAMEEETQLNFRKGVVKKKRFDKMFGLKIWTE